MAANLKKGLFITLEGPEGSGKSTQSRVLTTFLKKKGYKVIHIWDPGSTKFGEAIRDILLKPGGRRFSSKAETMLYLAARAQLVDEKIIPALKKNYIVICDRFIDATVCYQGYGLGVDIKEIERFNDFITGAITPDITFFLDINVKKGLKRSRNVKGFSDRIEKRGADFHAKVRNGYIKLLKKFPHRIKRISIDNNDKEKAQEIIRRVVSDAIERN
jgi:dTMP kinase